MGKEYVVTETFMGIGGETYKKGDIVYKNKTYYMTTWGSNVCAIGSTNGMRYIVPKENSELLQAVDL